MRATVRAGSLRSFSLVQDEGLGRIQTPRNACISNRSRRRTRTSSSPRPHGCWRRKTAGSPASPCSAIGGHRVGKGPRTGGAGGVQTGSKMNKFHPSLLALVLALAPVTGAGAGQAIPGCLDNPSSTAPQWAIDVMTRREGGGIFDSFPIRGTETLWLHGRCDQRRHQIIWHFPGAEDQPNQGEWTVK